MYQPPTIRIRVYMERALEQACRSLPHGGDHDVRSFIAERMNVAAAAKPVTLGELAIVARKALAEYRDPND